MILHRRTTSFGGYKNDTGNLFRSELWVRVYEEIDEP